MKTKLLIAFSLFLLCITAQAATTNTTLTVNATLTVGTSITASGPATLTGIGSGTFSATVSISAIGGTNITAPYTITLSGGTLTGNITVPAALLTGTATTGTGSATVTGGTGSFAGATGSFPSLSGTGSGSILAGLTATFTGAGSITTGGSGPPTTTGPVITAVQDAGSYTSNIAQGSIFVVKGTGLSAAGLVQEGFPLPASDKGVKITFTPAAGGAGTDAYIIYLYNQSGVNQLAAVLPSTVAPGNYNVTVTNGTTSANFAATVVARKPGLITQDSTGTGLAVVQNFISQTQLDINRLTTGTIGGFTISPAHPGQTLIAWGVGLGPVTGGDNTASAGFDFTKNGVNVQVLVGGVSITPFYAGRAPGLAGADQIDFTLPANVPTGCAVPFQVSVNGVLSNTTFISIAPDATASSCVSPGFTAAQLQKLDQGGTYTTGAFSLTQLAISVPTFGTVKQDSAGGAFNQFSAFQFAGAATANTFNGSGACVVTTSSGGSTAAVPGGKVLDAGTVTLTGPTGSGLTNVALKQDASNAYSLSIGTEGITIPGQTNLGSIVAGTYKINGAGGKDVGAFNASVTLGTPLTVTGGLPASINRSSSLTLNWTGGNSSDLVEIFGSSSASASSSSSTTFVCTTNAGAGTFTVPSSILSQLPASAANSGLIAVYSVVNPTAGNGLFSAPLTAGGAIDLGAFSALVGAGATATYQ